MTTVPTPPETPATVTLLPREWALADTAPIVAAIDDSAASGAVIAEATRLSRDLGAPVIFVHVRRERARFLGGSAYQRQLTRDMARAREVFDEALIEAGRAHVNAQAELLEGPPQKRLVEFARDRKARLLIVGHRPRRIGRSLTRGVAAAASQPVVVVRERDPSNAATDETDTPPLR